MRDYLIIGFILASVPIGLVRPFYGMLVYTWISYMYPHYYAWTFAQTFPVAKLSALSVMVGMALARTGNLAILRRREVLTMLLVWGTFTISTVFAIYPDRAWQTWQDVSKLILMALLSAMMLDNQARMRYFLFVVAGSLGFYGVKGGIFALATGGEMMVLGPGGLDDDTSIIGANNAIGLALNMCLPLLWYLSHAEEGWRRRVLQVSSFLTVPAILFTYSRASALTVGVVLMIIILKSRHRHLAIPMIMLAAFVALPIAASIVPEKWLQRQQTVATFEEDASAMSRIDNWKFCWRLAVDRPWTGGGFEFQTREMFVQYAPEFLMKYGGKVWDTHSIYLAILAGHGFLSFIVFFGMIGFAMLSCRSMRRAVRNRPDLSWVAAYSDAIQVSLFAFLVNGAFVNMEYFDLIYTWVAVVASLRVLSGQLLHTENVPVEEPINIEPAATLS